MLKMLTGKTTQSGGERKALIKGATYSKVQGFKKKGGAQFLIHSPNAVS